MANITRALPRSEAADAGSGDVLDYQFRYTNISAASAQGVTVWAFVPAHSRLLSCSSPCTATGLAPGSTITWKLGTKAPDATAVLSFRVTVDTPFLPVPTMDRIVSAGYVTTAAGDTVGSNAVTVSAALM